MRNRNIGPKQAEWLVAVLLEGGEVPEGWHPTKPGKPWHRVVDSLAAKQMIGMRRDSNGAWLYFLTDMGKRRARALKLAGVGETAK